MNNKIKIALAIITGGTLICLSRKIKKRGNKSKTFEAPDGNTYKEGEMYFTADGNIYKNGKLLQFKTPKTDDDVKPKTNFKYEAAPKSYDMQSKNVNYHQKGIRHH